jgi:hypothetical protein
VAFFANFDASLAGYPVTLRSGALGFQLWHCSLYSLASSFAAGGGVFGLGPLSEVVAMNHTWNELADHLQPGPERELVAYERVIRGDVPGPDEIDGRLLELPTRLEAWEPAYPTASYEPYRATFPAPNHSEYPMQVLGESRPEIDDESVDALLALTAHWSAGSTGRTEAVMVEGSAGDAIATLGLNAVSGARVTAAEALASMAWAAASGGAHGRRRGMATGRFDAWWALASLAGLDEPWPPSSSALGEAAGELDWLLWKPPLPESGWSLHLAVEDGSENLAWAISAVDAG